MSLPILLAVADVCVVAFALLAPSTSPAQPNAHNADPFISPPGQNTAPLTALALEQAIARVLERNPLLQAARLDEEAADAQREQAALRPNPTLSFDYQRVPGPSSANNSSLSIPLELGGKRQARIDAADATARMTQADISERQAQLRANAIGAYFEILSAQDRVELALESIETARRATVVTSRRVQAGRVSPVEESRAQAAEAAAQIDLNQARTELQIAQFRLAALWGESDAAPIVAQRPAPATLPAGTLRTLIAQVPQSPQMLRARAQVDKSQAQLRLERSRATPDAALNLSTGTLIENGWRSNQIGVSVELPIFDRNQGGIREASVRVRQAMQQLVAVDTSLQTGITQSWLRWQSAQREIRLAQQDIVARGSQTLEATTRGFELGKFSFLEVLDAQRTLFAGRAQLLRATAESWQARAEIERLLGAGNAQPDQSLR